MSETPNEERWTLYNLPFAARLAIAAFLISVGLGYLSALVNLHFQEATPGEILPTDDDVVRAYHGKSKMSQFERLITANPELPFNGTGSMRRVFTSKRVLWNKGRMKVKAEQMKIPEGEIAAKEAAIKAQFYKELDGERKALIGWLRSEASKEAYENDSFPLEGELAKLEVTPEFIEEVDGKRSAMIQSIIKKRCVSCHADGSGDRAEQFPLTNYDYISSYTSQENKGRSLAKLALTTHVHLLGFAMLYGLTGLILALTPLPGWIRVPLAPLPLIAQVVDISFWWLARMDEPYGPMFALGIKFSGMVVALSLVLQILLTLFSIFNTTGKVVLFVLIVAVVGGGVGLKPKLDDYLKREAATFKEAEDTKNEKKDEKKDKDNKPEK